MSYISAKQAIELIKNQPENFLTKKSLEDLINCVDLKTSGEITLFYSGSYANDNTTISAQSIAKAMDENGDSIRIIYNTQIAKLLENKAFKIAAGKALDITDQRELTATFNDRSSALNTYFYTMPKRVYGPMHPGVLLPKPSVKFAH